MGVHYSLDRIYGDPAALAREFVQDTLNRIEKRAATVKRTIERDTAKREAKAKQVARQTES
jgi:hypothetical protein